MASGLAIVAALLLAAVGATKYPSGFYYDNGETKHEQCNFAQETETLFALI